jgi:hypothetical protein
VAPMLSPTHRNLASTHLRVIPGGFIHTQLKLQKRATPGRWPEMTPRTMCWRHPTDSGMAGRDHLLQRAIKNNEAEVDSSSAGT